MHACMQSLPFALLCFAPDKTHAWEISQNVCSRIGSTGPPNDVRRRALSGEPWACWLLSYGHTPPYTTDRQLQQQCFCFWRNSSLGDKRRGPAIFYEGFSGKKNSPKFVTFLGMFLKDRPYLDYRSLHVASTWWGFKKFRPFSLTCSQIWLSSLCGGLPVLMKLQKKNPLFNTCLWNNLLLLNEWFSIYSLDLELQSLPFFFKNPRIGLESSGKKWRTNQRSSNPCSKLASVLTI
jgi:hypothetical protein